MTLSFAKYHGTGNDFILIDNRSLQLQRHNPNLYAFWCHRRFGIGADGVILLQKAAEHDFEMVYYNADGYEGSMCGNGGRCAVAYAQQLGLLPDAKARFLAADGTHNAHIDSKSFVALQMQPVGSVQVQEGNYVLNTGSPHFVQIVPDLNTVDVFAQGAQIRYSLSFKEQGINVNFVETTSDALKVATYERGVENETYSCGTGVVASGIAYALHQNLQGTVTIPVETKGGQLWVQLTRHPNNSFTDVWLKGPATFVFSGHITTNPNGIL